MLDLILGVFGWLPTPLALLMDAVFVIFFVSVLISLIAAVYKIVEFITSIMGGVLAKVVKLFVE